jgi:hypothetical protein
MAGERIRAFLGADELELTGAKYTINNETVVNSASFSIAPEPDVKLGSVIDFKKDDGSTNVFSGRVHNISEPNVWEIETYSNGYELINNYVEKVYQNVSPESIVQDIVENFTENLTYGGTASSGIIIEEYIAQGYAIDIVRDMITALRWRLTINQNDVVDFATEGAINNGLTLTNGNGFNVLSWETSDGSVVNHVRVEAGFELPRTIEVKSGTGTTFALNHKPEGSVRVLVSATEVPPEDYEVKPESLEIIFGSSVTDPTIEYTWRRRIVVEDEDEGSIAQHGERFQRVDAPYIITRPDARRFARQFIAEYAGESVVIVGAIPDLRYDIAVNERVSVIDALRSKSFSGVIINIEYSYDTGETILKVGSRDFDFVNWQNGVQDRIKQLERRFTSSDTRTFVRSFTKRLQVELESPAYDYELWTANNSLIANHLTLGYARENENAEVDCSGNEHHGEWLGTDIDGDQYLKEGYRLYCATLNGAEYCAYVGTIADVESLSFFHKDLVADTGLITLTATASVSVDTEGDIVTTGLSGATVVTVALADDWFYTYIVFDAVSVDLLEVGRVGSSYADGLFDEFMLFDAALTSDERQWIVDKKLYSGQALYAKLLLWWSMDNPVAGDFREQIFP